MKFAALLVLFAVVGKMSAVPSPYRMAFYRTAAVPQLQQELDEAESEEENDDVSQEDFSNANIQGEIQDDDDDSDEQESPPEFHKLFPLPQRNGPGHNMPLAVMMSGISADGWKVPKAPIKKNQQRARFELARDDDEDDEDSDEDEEDEEEEDDVEDDLPQWQKMFPNLQDEANAGPPQGVVDTSSQPEIQQAFRSGMGGSRVVYIPTRNLRRSPQIVQSGGRQYVMRSPAPQRSQVMYGMMPSSSPYIRRQPVVQSRPQYVIASPSAQRRPQYVMASSSMQRRPQQSVYYMPVRRNSYNPYVSPYVPRYRYY
jgi:hypothetical protein